MTLACACLLVIARPYVQPPATEPPSPAGWPASPIRHSEVLDRPLRQDGLETLGISTQTWIEVAADEGHWELALELTEYFAHEISVMNQVLFTWLTFKVIDPKLRALSDAFDARQGEFLKSVEKQNRWEA